MKKPTRIMLVLSACLFFNSCVDSSIEPQKYLAESKFLISQSNAWIYSFYDSLKKENDTVVVKSLGKKLYDNREEAYVWQLRFAKYIDTHYVFISKNLDSLRIIPSFNSRERYFKIRMLFPLSLGKKWKGEWFNDTIRVLKKENVTIGVRTYKDVFYLEEKWGALNEYGNMKIWYLPQIGFIKISRREWGFGFMNQTWELLKHDNG